MKVLECNCLEDRYKIQEFFHDLLEEVIKERPEMGENSTF